MSNNQIIPGNLPTEEMEVGEATAANLPISTGKGKTPLNVSETEKILQNMQRIIDERSSGLNTILGGLKDATAWAGGGTEGPTATLAARDRVKNIEQKELLDMQMDMARLRAQEAQQREFAKRQSSPDTYQGFPTGDAQAANIVGDTPGLSVRGGQIMYQGKYPIPLNIAMAMRNATSQEAVDKIFRDYSMEVAKGDIKFGTEQATYQADKKIKVPDGHGKYKLELVNARVARDIDDLARTRNISQEDAAEIYFSRQQGRPAPAAGTGPVSQATPVMGGPVSAAAIKQVESGGQEGLVSRAGAQGVMQVMPNTQKNPGYGVRPARDDSPAELERVGVDYFNAMKSKYGNDTLAAIAYNMGPNKADAWIKSGGHFKDLPKETQEYIPKVYLAQAQMDRQSGAPVTTARAEQAPRPATRRAAQSIPEMEAELEAIKEGRNEEFKKRGASLSEAEVALKDASSNAPDTLATSKYIDKIATDQPNIFGLLQEPTAAAAFAKLVEKGISAGSTTISLSGLTDAIRRATPGVTKDELIAVEKVGQQLAKLKLTAARTYLKGQGAVSNFERDIIADFTGSVDNSVEALKDFMAWNTMRATYDQKVGKIYKDWQKTGNNRNKSFQDFVLDSEAYENATNEYRTQIGEFGARGGLNYKSPGKGSAASGQTSGKVKWSVVQ
jgi:hypothetical protein